MSPVADPGTGNAYRKLLQRIMVFLAALVVARFVLEVTGTPQVVARYVSATVGLIFAGIYFAAIGPLKRRPFKYSQLVLPALILSAWSVGWVILATVISAVFRLQRSHYAEREDYGNWGHLGGHVLGHLIGIVVLFVVLLVLMALVQLLWRWPVTVGPGVVLGALVVTRFWLEAMGVTGPNTAAWSSTVAVLIAGFYLGGVGPLLGLRGGRQLVAPALVLGWTWRLWVFIAILMSAIPTPFMTHFFNRAGGHVAARLAQALGGTAVEGLIAGLILWGIAVWIASATRREETA